MEANSTVRLPVAHLEQRFQAFVLDRLVAWLLPALAGVLTWLVAGDGLTVILGVTAGTAAAVWLVMAVVLGISGSSPGKALLGLRVVHHGTGTAVGVGPALLRSLVISISGIPTFGIGIATLAWTAVEDRGGERRGWHDHVTNTVVVDLRPAPAEAEVTGDDGPRHIVNLTAMRLIPAPLVETPETPARSQEQSMRRRPMTPTVAPTPPPAPPSGPAPGTHSPSPPMPLAPTPRWKVDFDHGDSFVVEGTVLIGRRPEAKGDEVVTRLVALPSPDMSVSKTHAQLGVVPDGALVVMDRGSTNGTTLVRKGVARPLTPGRPATLIDGDMVVFGDRRMLVSIEA